jgi:hypothetical protein
MTTSKPKRKRKIVRKTDPKTKPKPRAKPVSPAAAELAPSRTWASAARSLGPRAALVASGAVGGIVAVKLAPVAAPVVAFKSLPALIPFGSKAYAAAKTSILAAAKSPQLRAIAAVASTAASASAFNYVAKNAPKGSPMAEIGKAASLAMAGASPQTVAAATAKATTITTQSVMAAIAPRVGRFIPLIGQAVALREASRLTVSAVKVLKNGATKEGGKASLKPMAGTPSADKVPYTTADGRTVLGTPEQVASWSKRRST